MLEFLEERASERKLRLFFVWCCRRIWPLLTDERSRWAVQVAERYADGLAEEQERIAAWTAARSVGSSHDGPEPFCFPIHALLYETASEKQFFSWELVYGLSHWWHEPSERVSASEIVHIIREIFGNPFQGALIQQEWLAWNHGTTRKIALAAYEERAFGRMPILADALEDAGCDNADILNHCRNCSEHVHGCWVVDLLLGKS